MLFRALIWRPLRNDWGRTLLSVAAIALGVAVVIAIRVANRSAIGSFAENTHALAGDADLLVTGPAPITPALLARLRPLGAEAEITPYIEHNGAIELELVALAEFVPRPAASAANVAQIRDLPADAAQFDGLRVKLAPGSSVAAVAAQLRSLIPAADTLAPPPAQVAEQAKMLAAFRYNLAALSYVALLVGIFLIYNTVSISVVRRRVAIATVRALGVTRRRVLRLFLAEGAVLSLVGGAVGLGLGWLLAAGALGLMQRTINNLYAFSPVASARLLPSDALWGLGIALAAGLFAAWTPARQAAGLRPAESLRPGSAELPARRRSGRAWMAALALGALSVASAHIALGQPSGAFPWFGFAAALAAVFAWAALTPWLLAIVLPRLRASLLRRSRAAAGLAAGSLVGALRRSSILTVAVATAIGVMLGVGIMVGSFRQTVNLWIGQQLRDDVYIRAATVDRTHPVEIPRAAVAALIAAPGARAVAALRSQPWTFRGDPITVNVHWLLRGDAAEPNYQFLQGGRGAVMVSEPFARRFGIWTGSRFTLAANAPLALTVNGVFYDYSSDRGLVVLDLATYTRGFGWPAPTNIGVDGVSRGSVPSPPGVVVTDNAQLRSAAMHVFDQTFRITYALEIITLLVAILGVGNTLLAVILERGDELALLRYLGATRRQIRAILLAEAGLIATLALAIGWGMGIALAIILARVINVESFGWTIAFHLPVVVALGASVAVWLATLAAGWLPAHFAPQAMEAAE